MSLVSYSVLLICQSNDQHQDQDQDQHPRSTSTSNPSIASPHHGSIYVSVDVTANDRTIQKPGDNATHKTQITSLGLSSCISPLACTIPRSAATYRYMTRTRIMIPKIQPFTRVHSHMAAKFPRSLHGRKPRRQTHKRTTTPPAKKKKHNRPRFLAESHPLPSAVHRSPLTIQPALITRGRSECFSGWFLSCSALLNTAESPAAAPRSRLRAC